MLARSYRALWQMVWCCQYPVRYLNETIRIAEAVATSFHPICCSQATLSVSATDKDKMIIKLFESSYRSCCVVLPMIVALHCLWLWCLVDLSHRPNKILFRSVFVSWMSVSAKRTTRVSSINQALHSILRIIS